VGYELLFHIFTRRTSRFIGALKFEILLRRHNTEEIFHCVCQVCLFCLKPFSNRRDEVTSTTSDGTKELQLASAVSAPLSSFLRSQTFTDSRMDGACGFSQRPVCLSFDGTAQEHCLTCHYGELSTRPCRCNHSDL
jgi:hypothetical protein